MGVPKIYKGGDRLAFPILSWKERYSALATTSLLGQWRLRPRHLYATLGPRNTSKHASGHLKSLLLSIFTTILWTSERSLPFIDEITEAQRRSVNKTGTFYEKIWISSFSGRTRRHGNTEPVFPQHHNWLGPSGGYLRGGIRTIHLSSSLLCLSISVPCMSLEVIPTRWLYGLPPSRTSPSFFQLYFILHKNFILPPRNKILVLDQFSDSEHAEITFTCWQLTGPDSYLFRPSDYTLISNKVYVLHTRATG